MSQYKLVALDMDGTLLNEEKQVSPANREAIYAALEAGVTVIFSTGRGVQSALPYAEELKLQTPIVSVNGSEVWKAPHDLLKRTLLDLDLVRRMYDLAIEHDTWYWAYSVEGMYNRDNWAEDITKPEWLKFGFYTENKESLEIIRGELARWGELEITNSHPDNLELNPKGISKASGIEEVCKLLGIEMSQVIAMGDSENDIAMIRAAGLGVAMGNAQDGVKRIADLVTVTNDEDGVAKIIQEYVLDPLSAR
ncbi:5-amino-6-(5-phospho-D-ribitylamino)uracil phosphatase YcsE [Paenibacillus chitinolyticus]|uniref:Cof-type HAD-IIB family hydrolase n=1 Tax=Paenibacillus chitinolyticus TaxID=79263 RepID=UPI0026E4F6A0|nr:Cof-type HAD-IIB family hydrolase [Paenibacillus chitinolyticus]GKS13676.1 5-amino-6-(5-phospho-D-ribitylamino)uracil phosphatase YcsE [Paenibacillus chitinolyticus]